MGDSQDLSPGRSPRNRFKIDDGSELFWTHVCDLRSAACRRGDVTKAHDHDDGTELTKLRAGRFVMCLMRRSENDVYPRDVARRR